MRRKRFSREQILEADSRDILEVAKELKKNGVFCSVDNRSEKIGYKIREAQMQKIPYMLVVGAKEEEEGKVSVRSRFAGDEGQKCLKDFLCDLKKEISGKVRRSMESKE